MLAVRGCEMKWVGLINGATVDWVLYLSYDSDYYTASAGCIWLELS